MYKGKHLAPRQRQSWKKSKALLVSLLLVISVTIGGTLAFLVTDSGPVKNTFTPSEVTTSVEETVSGTTKSNVMIKNTGDTTAYIRAAVVITWQDEAGNILGEVPATDPECDHSECDCDYKITYELGSAQGAECWLKGSDGFYYWTSPVEPSSATGVLIKECTSLQTRTIGSGDDAVNYYLTVEIIGSGIQSVPTSVVMDEWKSGVSDVSGDALTITQ